MTTMSHHPEGRHLESLLRFDIFSNPTAFPLPLLQFGLGFWEYMKDGFNVFDIIIVFLAYLEIVLSNVQVQLSA